MRLGRRRREHSSEGGRASLSRSSATCAEYTVRYSCAWVSTLHPYGKSRVMSKLIRVYGRTHSRGPLVIIQETTEW